MWQNLKWRRRLSAGCLAVVVTGGLTACEGPEEPRAMVRGMVVTPIEHDGVGRADVTLEVFLDPAVCSGTPFAVRSTEAGPGGDFSFLVSGHRGVMIEDACLNVRGAPPFTLVTVNGPRTVFDLHTTLRVEYPIDTVDVEVVLIQPPHR